MLLSSLLACVHPLPPGPTPAEQAALMPAPVVIAAEGGEVAVRAVVRAGSAHDPPGGEGLAWLTARAIVDGADDAALEALGGAVEVSVERDVVVFRGRAPAANAADFLALFGGMIAAPDLAAADLEALRAAADDAAPSGAAEIAAEALDAWLNEGHPYAHPAAGRAGTLSAIGAADLEAFYAARYRRAATRLGLAGDEALTEALLTPLAALSEAPYEPYLAIRPGPPTARELLAVSGEGPDGRVAAALGLPLKIGPADPDWPALLVAAAWLDGRDGLSASLTGGDSARLQGQLSVYIDPVEPEALGFALKAALREVEVLRERGLEDLDFARARGDLRAARADESPLDRLEREAINAALGLTDLDPALVDLAPADVGEALARHVDPERLRLVVVTADADAFLNEVFEGIETPAVYNGAMPAPDQIDADAEVANRPLGISPDRAFVARSGGLFQ
jgi:predicted Zn-dependent peptidase